MDIYNEVIQRLHTLGATVLSNNDFSVTFAIERAQEEILNDIHHTEMPEGLRYLFIDMAAGYYLHDKKAMGQLAVSGLDFDAAPAKQIKEGDVQITFAGGADGSQTPEQRVDSLIARLTHPDPAQLNRYRRLSW